MTSRAPSIRVVVYVARDHGLACLRHLIDRNDVEVAAIATHRYLPSSESHERSQRAEFAEIADLSRSIGAPLFEVQGASDRDNVLIPKVRDLQFDLLISVSWRLLITEVELAKPLLGGINLHRGALPLYAGAEPVVRALADRQPSVVVTAHELTSEIDGGRQLATVSLPVDYRDDPDVASIKTALTPLFPILLDASIDMTKALANR